MRTLIIAAFAALALLAAGPSANAQGGHVPPNTNEQRQAMARLAPLVGDWTGEAHVSSPAQAIGYHVEQVESALDGLLIIFRGASYANPQHTGAPVFQALAVVSYNDASDTYEFRSYTRGYSSNATGEFLEDGSFRWSLSPGGQMRMRYTIRFDANSWREIGESSTDGGQTWTQTIDMTLTRTP